MANLDYEKIKYAKLYMLLYNKYSPKKMFIRDPLNSKWAVYFVKTVNMFGNREHWDARKFLIANFKTFGLLYPQQLSNEQKWENYIDYLPRFEENDIKAEIEDTLNKIKKFKDIHEFIDKNKIFINNYSKYVLYFSRTYFKYLKETGKKIDPNNVKIKRLVVMNNKESHKKIIETLGNDYV